MKNFKNIILILLWTASVVYSSTVTINNNSFSINSSNEPDDKTVIEYRFGKFDSKEIQINNQTFSILKLEKQVNIQKKGYPALPKISKSIIIPDNRKMKVEILESDFTEYIFNVSPAKGVIVRPNTPDDIPYTFSDV